MGVCLFRLPFSYRAHALLPCFRSWPDPRTLNHESNSSHRSSGPGKTREMICVLDNYFLDPRPKVPIFPKDAYPEPRCINPHTSLYAGAGLPQLLHGTTSMAQPVDPQETLLGL